MASIATISATLVKARAYYSELLAACLAELKKGNEKYDTFKILYLGWLINSLETDVEDEADGEVTQAVYKRLLEAIQNYSGNASLNGNLILPNVTISTGGGGLTQAEVQALIDTSLAGLNIETSNIPTDGSEAPFNLDGAYDLQQAIITAQATADVAQEDIDELDLATEKIVNKSTSVEVDKLSDVKYPSSKSVYEHVEGKISGINDAISVKDYGATGDGTTNDQAAIQLAMDYCIANGRSLFFPMGTYRINSTILISNYSKKIFSYGATIKLVSDSVNIMTISTSESIEITGLKFLGTSLTNQNGIEISSSTRHNIHDCVFTNLTKGIVLNSAATESFGGVLTPVGSLILSCTFKSCDRGVYVVNSEYCQISDSLFTGCTSYGIWNKSGNLSITSNRFIGNSIGIWVDGVVGSGNSDHGLISNNLINHSIKCGILVSNLRWSQTISCNEIWATIGDETIGGNLGTGIKATSFGIYVENAENLKIIGNTIARNKFGIGINGWNNSAVVGNTFIADNTRTTNHIKELGDAGRLGYNSQNLIDSNTFSATLTTTQKNIELYSTSITTKIGSQQGDSNANRKELTSGTSGDFVIDGSIPHLFINSDFPGALSLNKNLEGIEYKFTFIKAGTTNKAITFPASATISSTSNGVAVASNVVTFTESGLYFINAIGENSYIISSTFNKKDTVTTLTYAGTTNLDFDAENVKTLSLTGNITFTTSNKGAGKQKVIRIISDASIRTFTFPAWTWLGTAPASIAASKTAVLSLYCFGSSESDVVAAYSVQS